MWTGVGARLAFLVSDWLETNLPDPATAAAFAEGFGETILSSFGSSVPLSGKGPSPV